MDHLAPLLTGASAFLALASLVFFIRTAKKKKFVKVGRVSKIIIYPVKSFAGCEVKSARCTQNGLTVGKLRDRAWVLVNKTGDFIRLTAQPKMVLLRPRLQNNQLWIDGPGKETLKINILDSTNPNSKIIKCKILNAYMDGLDCGDEAAAWMQSYLNKPDIRLVQYPPDRPLQPGFLKGLVSRDIEEKYPIMFHNGSEFLLLGQPSIDDLNGMLEEKVSYKNFRPNFVIEGCGPYEEDRWQRLMINSVLLEKLIPCTRCQIITVNPETGEKAKNEPLETLKTYRQSKNAKVRKAVGKAPVFGINYGLDVSGEVHVGDDVYAVVG